MTNNQIQYWKLQEDMRAHRANEQLAGRTQQEVERANRAKESHNVNLLAETNRSNRANEMLGYAKQTETNRANRASEAIGRQQAVNGFLSAQASQTAAEARQTAADASLIQAEVAQSKNERDQYAHNIKVRENGYVYEARLPQQELYLKEAQTEKAYLEGSKAGVSAVTGFLSGLVMGKFGK